MGRFPHLSPTVGPDNRPVAMRVSLITPSSEPFLDGNRVTARRWARILRELNHRVRIQAQYDGWPSDLLIALHARKSHESVRRFRKRCRNAPLILALTGTDLYRDLPESCEAQQSLNLATRLVVLQRQALAELPEHFHAKTCVIYQSAERVTAKAAPPSNHFQVAVIGHLRKEKDPFRTAMAARHLPASSRLKVLHVGGALSSDMKKRAEQERARNPRYQWLDAQPHAKTRQLLARSHLLVLTSRMEGSSNVLSEALASSIPVLATQIPGMIGTLGPHYPGYFPVGNTRALTFLLQKAESDPDFYEELKRHGARLAPLVHPPRERAAWKELLEEL